ncbi:MAG: hypothetical protein IJ033_05370 [Clostridia bacterium]|nr:hypothetical protein [Clostridia bacterium]
MSDKRKKLNWDIKGWHLALLYPLTIIFIVGSMVLINVETTALWLDILSYVCFTLSAIGLALSIYTIVKKAPEISKNVTTWLRKNAFINRLFEHYDFRTIVFNTLNFLVNIGYVIFNAVIGIVSKSVWYGSLAAYYLILTVMRGVIVLYHGKNALLKIERPTGYEKMSDKQVELRLYRLNGILLILLPIALSFVILDMVQNGSAFVRWGWTVLGFAAVAFYKVIASIVQISRSRKKSEDYTIYGLRNIGFAAALVTILSLQTSLLHSFGSQDFNTPYANAATGAGVCAVTAIMGIIMIVQSSKKIKTLNIEEKEQKENHD